MYLQKIYIKCLLSLFFSFIFFLIITPIAIKIFKKLKIKQYTKKNSFLSHIKKKNTPAIGGILIIFTTIISLLLFSAKNSNPYIKNLFIIFLSNGSIGLLDDYLKIKNKNGHGLSWKWKYFLLSIISIFISIKISCLNQDNLIYKNIKIFNNSYQYIKIIMNILIYYLLMILSSNAINITDGLDGLAIFPFILVNIGFTIIALIHGNINLSQFFNWPYNHMTNDILIFCNSILGSSLGFLWFNAYPAKIFMGDTGSLSLGGILGLISIFLEKKIFLLCTGGVFFLETLSIIFQIIYLKFKKKKFFLKVPIHSYYEMKNIPETTIVTRFWIISILLLIINITVIFLKK